MTGSALVLIQEYDCCMSRKGRMTNTLDQALIDMANAAVAAGQADSVSAWINRALAEHGAFTPAEMARHERDVRRKAIVVRGSGTRSGRRRRKKAA